MPGAPALITKLEDDKVETIPDTKNVRLSLELTPAELERMGLLTERLGIRHPDDIIRYCIAQVTWWVLAGPMSTATLQEAMSSSKQQSHSQSHDDKRYGNAY